MRLLRLLIFLALFMLIAVPAVLIYLTFEDAPAVNKTELIDTEKAVRATKFAGRTMKELLRRGNDAPVSIRASEEDLNSLMAVMARGMKSFSGDVKISQTKLDATVTVRLPRNPVGDFINLSFGIYPSESGLHLSPVTIGRIKISGRMALFITRFMLDLLLGNENGTVAMNSVQSVSFNQDAVIFKLRRIPDLMERKDKIVQRFKIFRDSMPLFSLSDTEKVRHYYAKLMSLDHGIKPGQRVSLAYIMGPLFELAKLRSVDSDPAEENKAALLALAMYFGDSRFEKLIGPVRTDDLRSGGSRHRNVLLGGREDLRLHFVISAGLKIVADSGLTDAVGEFKELSDARRGGSGFSFADLAADLAGTRLAEEATDASGGAERIQAIFTGRVAEDMFFPTVYDLPENIPQAEFERTYGSVEDPKYLHLVEVIKARISQLPAYRR